MKIYDNMVKKAFIFLLLLFLLPAKDIFAQLEYKDNQFLISPVVSIGLPLIANQNNYGYSELAYKMKIGGHIGIMFGYERYLKSSFKVGVLYAFQGQNYKDVIYNLEHEKKISLTYIQIPALYKYVLGDVPGYDLDAIRKYVFIGGQLGYLVDAKMEFKRDGKEVDFLDFISYHDKNTNLEEIKANGVPVNAKPFFTSFDFGIVAGFGLQYFTERRMYIFAEATSYFGLLDINDQKWRFRNNKREYSGSLNMYGGLRIGLTYLP